MNKQKALRYLIALTEAVKTGVKPHDSWIEGAEDLINEECDDHDIPCKHCNKTIDDREASCIYCGLPQDDWVGDMRDALSNPTYLCTGCEGTLTKSEARNWHDPDGDYCNKCKKLS